MNDNILNRILIEWDNTEAANGIISSEDISNSMSKFSISKVDHKYFPETMEELDNIIIEKFKEAIETDNIADLRDIDISNITENNWDRHTVLVSLFEAFTQSYTIPEVINVSHWDTSKQTDISYCFSECKTVKRIIGLETWDTSKVRSMTGLFEWCENLEDIGNISKWNTSSVININDMFCSCKKLGPLENKLIIDCRKREPLGNKRIRIYNIVDGTGRYATDFIDFINIPEGEKLENYVTPSHASGLYL
jgi:hypothetical protein